MSIKIEKLLDYARHTQENGRKGEHVQILLRGAPGIGKTARVRKWAESINYEIDTFILGNVESVDIGGIWAPDFAQGKLIHMITDRLLATDIAPDKDGRVIFFDEIANAPVETQTAILTPLSDRMHENKKIPDNVVFVAACNASTHNCGSNDLIKSLESRFMVVDITSDADEWITEFAIPAGVDKRIVKFISWKKDMLMNFDPDSSEPGSPNDRSWDMLSAMIKQIPQSRIDEIHEIATRIVGKTAATEFVAYIEIEDEIATVEEIIADPTGCIMPHEKVSALYATIMEIAYFVSERNINRKHGEKKTISKKEGESIITYLRRMPSNLAVFGFKMIDNLNKDFSMSTGEYGKFQIEYDKI